MMMQPARSGGMCASRASNGTTSPPTCSPCTTAASLVLLKPQPGIVRHVPSRLPTTRAGLLFGGIAALALAIFLLSRWTARCGDAGWRPSCPARFNWPTATWPTACRAEFAGRGAGPGGELQPHGRPRAAGAAGAARLHRQRQPRSQDAADEHPGYSQALLDGTASTPSGGSAALVISQEAQRLSNLVEGHRPESARERPAHPAFAAHESRRRGDRRGGAFARCQRRPHRAPAVDAACRLHRHSRRRPPAGLFRTWWRARSNAPQEWRRHPGRRAAGGATGNRRCRSALRTAAPAAPEEQRHLRALLPRPSRRSG